MTNDTPEQRPYGSGDASFQAAGGQEGIRRLVDAFYQYMDTLPDAANIRCMHSQDLTESRQKLTDFLCGWLGGPKRYSEKYGPIVIPQAHTHLAIGYQERDAWLLCMEKALADQPYAEDFKEYLLRQLAAPAEFTRQACERVQQQSHEKKS